MIHVGRLPIKHTVRDFGHGIDRLIPRLSMGASHKFAALSYLSISGLQDLYYSALLINILELMHSVTNSELELSKPTSSLELAFLLQQPNLKEVLNLSGLKMKFREENCDHEDVSNEESCPRG